MSFLTQTQMQKIEGLIISKVHKPNLNNFLGKFAVHSVVKEVDVLLSNALPPDISHILADVNQGLTPDEIQHLKEILPGYLLKNVKNPLLSAILSEVIAIVVDALVTALQQGKSI